jgi:hypothetical protein
MFEQYFSRFDIFVRCFGNFANDGTSDIKNINSFDNVLYMILYGKK